MTVQFNLKNKTKDKKKQRQVWIKYLVLPQHTGTITITDDVCNSVFSFTISPFSLPQYGQPLKEQHHGSAPPEQSLGNICKVRFQGPPIIFHLFHIIPNYQGDKK